MPSRIHLNEKLFTTLLGEPCLRELTFPKIFKDSWGSIAPVLVERGGEFSLVIGAFDAGALAAAKTELPVRTFGRYFDWNQGADFKFDGFAEAVRDLAGDGELVVDAAIPFGRYDNLAQSGRVSVADGFVARPVHIYRKARAELETQWHATRDADVPGLEPFVSTLRFGSDLLAGMKAEPLGFSILDRLAGENGLDAILIDSAFNVEMFTGFPEAVAKQAGVVALYLLGAPEILVLSETELDRGDFKAAGRAPTLAAALRDLVQGRLGVEAGHISVALHRALGETGLSLSDGTHVLRRWQDERAGTDLLYFITAANAVLHGIDHAKAFMDRRLSAGLWESELAAVYHMGVQDFARSVGMAGRVHPYFDIIHSGERTLLPAIAGDYPVGPDNKTIKFDMGLLVTDAFGCVRGCSDLGRAFSPDPALQEAHDRLHAILVDDLIPSIKPGMRGEEVHARGVEVLTPITEPLKQVGLLHPEMDMTGYTRDCGHTLQRQTLATVHFMPGDKGVVGQHMLGCTEFVWPIDDKIIAMEDGYYVTQKSAVPFSV